MKIPKYRWIVYHPDWNYMLSYNTREGARRCIKYCLPSLQLPQRKNVKILKYKLSM